MAEREVFKVEGDKEAWERYRENGSEDGLTRITADEILKAIVEEKDIDIQRVIINGDLDIKTIGDQIKDEKGKLIIKGRMAIYNSDFRDRTSFSGATFDIIGFAGAYFNKIAPKISNVSMKNKADFADVHIHESTFKAFVWNDILRKFTWYIYSGDELHKINLSDEIKKVVVTDFSIGFDTNAIMDGSTNPYLKRYIEDQQWITSWRKRG